jgi:hypothetical protein
MTNSVPWLSRPTTRKNLVEEITVLGVNKKPFSTYGFVSFPTDSLGTEYILVTWSSDGEFMIIGVTDGGNNNGAVTVTWTCLLEDVVKSNSSSMFCLIFSINPMTNSVPWLSLNVMNIYEEKYIKFLDMWVRA